MTMSLTSQQLYVIERPTNAKLFLEGTAGCGKTCAAVERLLYLMENDIPANEILLLTPRRTLAEPYLQALNTPGVTAGGTVTALTISGLAQRMVELFFPLVAPQAGFAHPENPPIFLTQETAQYYMARIVHPLFADGAFDTLVMDRNRIYSQILDGLDKSALNGFSHNEIGTRLKSDLVGDKSQ